MIRINLVAGERRAAKTVTRSFEIEQNIAIIGSLIGVVALTGIGWRYWALGRHAEQVTLDIDTARRAEARLAEVIEQVAEFEAQSVHLHQRVSLINELRRGQSAPVHVIDQISRSLPDMIWLQSIKQESYDVTIVGRSTTQMGLSDFVGNLEATRYFKRPVEIVESEIVSGQDNQPDLIGFTIKGTFQMEGLETPAAPAAKKPAKGGNTG